MINRLFSMALGAALAVAAILPAAVNAAEKPLKVGVRGGTDELIWEVVAEEARKAGQPVEVIVITGSASPNEALNNRDLDANSFQHVPFLKDQVNQRGYKLAAVGDTYISPIAFYTKKDYKSLADLPEGAKLGIPNDPSNQTRVLVVLRDAGLVTLKDGADPVNGVITLNDVASNPKNFQFIETTAPILTRSLEDVDAGAITNSFAYQAGLIATRDGIAVEKREGNPYVNVIAVREEDKDAPWVQTLVKAYQSEPVRKFIEEKFEGSVIPAF